MPEPVTEPVSIVLPASVPVGEMTTLVPNYAPTDLRWEFPPQDGLQAKLHGSELTIVPKTSGTFTVGVGTATQPTAWASIIAGSGKAPASWLSWLKLPDLSWVKGYIPTLGTVAKTGLGGILGAFLLWLVTHYTPPVVPPINPPVAPPVVVPPVPPTPVAVPPTSILQTSIQTAYEAELDPSKSTHTRDLADLFGNVIAAAKASGTVKTHKDLQTKVHAAADLAIGPTAIPKVRAALGAYLATVLPTDPNGVADDAYWVSVGVSYKAAADALNGVKR